MNLKRFQINIEEDKIKFNKTVELLEHENHLLKEQLEFFKKKLFQNKIAYNSICDFI